MHRHKGAGRLALSGLKPGRRIFIRSHGTEDLYHARLLAAQGASSSWAVITPTLDTYTEELAPSGGPFVGPLAAGSAPPRDPG